MWRRDKGDVTKHGKKYQDTVKLLDEGGAYSPAGGIKLVKKTA
jgi:hypothetical protein